jgi:hypothetical protein
MNRNFGTRIALLFASHIVRTALRKPHRERRSHDRRGSLWVVWRQAPHGIQASYPLGACTVALSGPTAIRAYITVINEILSLVENAIKDRHIPWLKPDSDAATNFDRLMAGLESLRHDAREAMQEVPLEYLTVDGWQGYVKTVLGQMRDEQTNEHEAAFRNRKNAIGEYLKHFENAIRKLKSKPALANVVAVKTKDQTEDEIILKIIRSQPQGRGILGRDIVKLLKAQGVFLAESTIRKHHIPRLKKSHGVLNRRARGGYFIP